MAVELQIGGEVWHRVDSLEASAPDDRHFVVTTDATGVTTMRFGDGIHGAQLPTGTDQIESVYRTAKHFVAVLQQQGRVIVDKDWNEGPLPGARLCGVYRGEVRDNVDPLAQSRVEVRVVGLGNLLLWALPCQPVGAAGVPAIGASVWVAFEGGNPTTPVWIGVAP